MDFGIITSLDLGLNGRDSCKTGERVSPPKSVPSLAEGEKGETLEEEEERKKKRGGRKRRKEKAREFIGQFIVTTNPRRYHGLD